MSEETKEVEEKKTEAPAKVEAKSPENKSGKLVVVRVRGLVRVKKTINDTMDMLGLYRKNYCVIVDKKQLGMIKKVKDYVTYGEIDKDTEALLMKKQEKGKNKKGEETCSSYSWRFSSACSAR